MVPGADTPVGGILVLSSRGDGSADGHIGARRERRDDRTSQCPWAVLGVCLLPQHPDDDRCHGGQDESSERRAFRIHRRRIGCTGAVMNG